MVRESVAKEYTLTKAKEKKNARVRYTELPAFLL